MRSRYSVRGRLIGGFVVLTMVTASLVLATMVSTAASPASHQVQPVPVPTPPDSLVPPQSQASQAPDLSLLGLPVLVAIGLAALRLWVSLPAERKALGLRRTATACQECG
jgi:hypothetical protein